MTIPIQGLGPQQGRAIGLDIAGEHGLPRGKQPIPTGGSSFGATLERALNQVSAAQDNASDHVQRFLRGEPVELHQVMAATEEAGIALEMLVEIRNKLTEAYRSVINMQG
jgi:flagellar hook-basal body complex protein FliE